MPMNYELYPADWREISHFIRYERAKGHCEWCGAEDRKPHPVTGSMVYLTTAHLGISLPDGTPGDKHNKMDCRPENLACLCQRCHLNYDRWDHLEVQRINRIQKRVLLAQRGGQLPLIEVDHGCR